MTARSLARLVCVLALLASGCERGSAEEGEDETAVPRRVNAQGRVVLSQLERRALDLQTTEARRGKLATRALRFGKASARPEEQALVVAPVTARLASHPSVTLGSEVAEGALLASIEPLPDGASRAGLAAQRRELQGQVEGARAHVRSKEVELDRVGSLRASQLATEADVARARAELQAEQARLASLQRAEGELASLSGGAVPVRAPVAGVVVSITSAVGALISQGEEIARIVRAGPRWIDVAAAPSDEVGTLYRARTARGWIDARLLNRGAVVAPDGTRQDRIEVPASDAMHVLPGATLAVEVVREVEGVIVPEHAVALHAADALVFVELEAGVFEPRKVELGPRDSGQLIVAAGIASGERVVTRGAPSLLAELGHGSESAHEADDPP